MKLQLDFDNKIVTLENNVNIKELVDKLTVVLKDYEKWTINTNNKIEWVSKPIIIDRTPYRPLPWWETQPIITYGTNTTSNLTHQKEYNDITGTYQLNIEN